MDSGGYVSSPCAYATRPLPNWFDSSQLSPHPFVPLSLCPSVPPFSVLHLINGEHYAGAERVQDLLAACLPQWGFRVGLACVKPDRFPRVRKCREAPLYETPMAHRFDLRVARQIAQIVRREGYQLIHTHTPRTALVGQLAAWWAGVPMLYHVHSPTVCDSTRRWQNRINGVVERLSLRRAAHLIAVSQALGQYMIAQGYAPARVSVVHNGVPVAEADLARTRPQHAWTVGCVALLRPRKGIEVLLQAVGMLRRENLPVRLRVVGPFETPQYEAELRALSQRLELEPWVEWAGFSDNVPAELAKMDLFVLPSLFGEGLPMVVLEAMSAGVPVIATRIEGLPEAIRDGVDGLLAQPGDAADLARAIRQFVSGQADWQQIRSNARQRQIEAFSDRSMAAGVAAVYRQVLGGVTINKAVATESTEATENGGVGGDGR